MQQLQYPELEVLPDGGRRLWWLLISVNQTYLYMIQYPWVGVLHQINAKKNVLQSNWAKSIWRAISRLWGIPERDPCMQMEEDNLVENLQCTSKSVVKIFYNRDIVSEWLLRRSGWWIANPWQDLMMTEEVPHGYVPIWLLPWCCEPVRGIQ